VSGSGVLTWLAELPFRWKLLGLATLIVLVELAFRRFGPRSRAYKRWTAFFQGLGVFWTAIILSLVYLLSVGPVSLFMRLFGKDPLDRSLRPEPSFWRRHEPNPLGAQAAVRHQF
jgi:hypothetical protein